MKYIYLTQTENDIAESRKDLIKGEDSDLIVISWKEQTEGLDFLPNSSWNQGRNFLRKLALSKYPDADYYIFFDDDISIKSKSGNPYREFEKMLNDHKPLIATPYYDQNIRRQTDMSKDVQPLYYFDANFNAYSNEAINEVLPYYEGFDNESWHYSQVILFQLANLLYKSRCLQFNNIQLYMYLNIKREYPRNRNLQKANDLIIDNLIDKSLASEVKRPEVDWYRQNGQINQYEQKGIDDVLKNNFLK